MLRLAPPVKFIQRVKPFRCFEHWQRHANHRRIGCRAASATQNVTLSDVDWEAEREGMGGRRGGKEAGQAAGEPPCLRFVSQQESAEASADFGVASAPAGEVRSDTGEAEAEREAVGEGSGGAWPKRPCGKDVDEAPPQQMVMRWKLAVKESLSSSAAAIWSRGRGRWGVRRQREAGRGEENYFVVSGSLKPEGDAAVVLQNQARLVQTGSKMPCRRSSAPTLVPLASGEAAGRTDEDALSQESLAMLEPKLTSRALSLACVEVRRCASDAAAGKHVAGLRTSVAAVSQVRALPSGLYVWVDIPAVLLWPSLLPPSSSLTPRHPPAVALAVRTNILACFCWATFSR